MVQVRVAGVAVDSMGQHVILLKPLSDAPGVGSIVPIWIGAQEATSILVAVENAVTESVTEAGKISRNIQQAIYEDAEAFFSGIDKLASAKSFSEAVEIQSSLLRARGEAFVSRAKATTDYLGKLAANGAKSAQDNFAKVYNKTA